MDYTIGRGGNVKVKVNFEIYIAIGKLLPVYRQKLFLLRCVNPAALPLVRCYSIREGI